MKKSSTQFSKKRLAAYSAMATAFIAAGADANGQIVYTDIADETVDIGEMFSLDVDGDGTMDFLFQATSTTGGSWSFARVFGYVSSYTVGGSSNALVGYSGPYLPYGSALDSGDGIGPDADFIYNTLNQVFLASIYAGVTYGAFANEDDKYLGFQFVIGADLHYGWARLDATVGDVSVTIKDFAYQATANTEILAGATVSEVANVISENDLTAYSFGNTINVIVKNLNANNATVEVVNLAGQVVYTNSLNMAGMQITLDNAATGNYILHIVTEDNAVYTKQLFVNN